MNWSKLLTLLTIIILIIVVSVIFFALNKTTIYDGVKIDGVKLDRLTMEETLDKLKNKSEKLRNTNIKLVYEDYSQYIKLADIGAEYDYYKAINEAYSVGRSGGIINRLKYIYTTKFHGYKINMSIKYDKSQLNKLVTKIAYELDQNGENADIKYIDKEFVTTSEVIGRNVNQQLLKERIINVVKSLNSRIVKIPVEDKIPDVTEKMLKEIKDVLGEFSTSLGNSSQERIYNIKRAAESTDGTVMIPEEVFSFNETTGARDENSGYKKAKVILRGNYVDSIGGGVCQVSTTLYNAALLSNLKVMERYPHSIPSNYVGKGRDATVVFGYLDFKFKNTSKIPVYIYMSVNNNKLETIIYGKKEDKSKEIRIETVVIEEIEPEREVTINNSLNEGEEKIVQKGRVGYKVKTYKVFYVDNKEVKRELISSDVYKSQKEMIELGSKVEEIKNEEEVENTEEQIENTENAESD